MGGPRHNSIRLFADSTAQSALTSSIPVYCISGKSQPFVRHQEWLLVRESYANGGNCFATSLTARCHYPCFNGDSAARQDAKFNRACTQLVNRLHRRRPLTRYHSTPGLSVFAYWLAYFFAVSFANNFKRRPSVFARSEILDCGMPKANWHDYQKVITRQHTPCTGLSWDCSQANDGKEINKHCGILNIRRREISRSTWKNLTNIICTCKCIMKLSTGGCTRTISLPRIHGQFIREGCLNVDDAVIRSARHHNVMQPTYECPTVAHRRMLSQNLMARGRR